MREYDQLTRELGTALTSFEQAILDDGPAASAALPQQRVRLVQAVNAYIACLGKHVSDQAHGTSVTAHGDRWRGAHDQLLELRLRYSQHISRWSGASIVADWNEYRRACNALIKEMRSHLNDVAGYPPLAA